MYNNHFKIYFLIYKPIDITYIQKLSTFLKYYIVNELNNKGMKIIK